MYFLLLRSKKQLIYGPGKLQLPELHPAGLKNGIKNKGLLQLWK